MQSQYFLRKPVLSDIEFYRKCLSENSWRIGYGIGQVTDEVLNSIAFGAYPNVERILVCRDSRILGFFHLETFPDDKRCLLSGGISTDTLNGGNGLRGLCLALDYVFLQLGYNKVCCEVYESNQISRRILLKVGFNLEGLLKKQIYDNSSKVFKDLYVFGFLRQDYPSEITRKLLRRVEYETE